MSNNPWRYEEHFRRIPMSDDYDGHYEVTNGDIVLYTIDDPEDITDTEHTLDRVVTALNESGCKFYVNTSAELNLHNENMLLRMALEQIRDSPSPCNEAEMVVWIGEVMQLTIDALKFKSTTNDTTNSGTNKG